MPLPPKVSQGYGWLTGIGVYPIRYPTIKLDNNTAPCYTKTMKTTTAIYINIGLIPKDLYDQIVTTCSHLSLLADTEGYSEGLTKKEQRTITKAWNILYELIEEPSARE